MIRLAPCPTCRLDAPVARVSWKWIIEYHQDAKNRYCRGSGAEVPDADVRQPVEEGP